MRTVTKKVLTEVKYRNGVSEWSFNGDEIEQIAKTGNELVADGYQITAPFYHDEKAVPVVKAEDLAYKNGGFWKNFRTEVNEKGKKVLTADLDVADEESYKKLGSTVTQTSIGFRKLFEGTSNDKKYENALLHIALVNNAIEAGQDNFKKDGQFAISMAQVVVEDISEEEEVDGDGIDYTVILEGLRENGIKIEPEGEELTCETLATLLHNYFNAEKELTMKPEGAEQKDQVLMAQIEKLTTENAEKDAKIAKLTGDTDVLMSQLMKTRKGGIKARALRLQNLGVLEKEACDNVFLSKLTDTITMAQIENLETRLETLELVKFDEKKAESVQMAGLIQNLDHLNDFVIPSAELEKTNEPKELTEEEILAAWGLGK